MASRGRKVVLVTLASAAVLVVLVVAAFWKPVGWDVSAWWRGADEVLTLPATGGWAGGGRVDISAGDIEVVEVARFLSLQAGVNVIVPAEHSRSPKSMILVASDMRNVTPDVVLALLRENGWRLRRSRLPAGDEVYTLELRE